MAVSSQKTSKKTAQKTLPNFLRRVRSDANEFLSVYLAKVFRANKGLKKIVWRIDGNSPQFPEPVGKVADTDLVASDAMQLLSQLTHEQVAVLYGRDVTIHITAARTTVKKN